MSALSERDYLADEICELFTKLTGDAYAEDMARARKLAEGGNPHDHWLHTTRLDYESRLFMYMAAAFAISGITPPSFVYRGSVFMRSAAEALSQPQD